MCNFHREVPREEGVCIDDFRNSNATVKFLSCFAACVQVIVLVPFGWKTWFGVILICEREKRLVFAALNFVSSDYEEASEVEAWIANLE